MRTVTALALLVVVASVVAWLVFLQPRVTRHQFDRVQNGMSSLDIQALLGEPESHELPAEVFLLSMGFKFGETPDWRFWGNYNGGIAVRFDREERVIAKHWVESESNLWDRLLGYFGL